MPDPIVCRCYGVTEGVIFNAIKANDLRTVEEVTAATNAAGGCSSCYDDVKAILDSVHGATYRRPSESRSHTDAEKRVIILDLVRDAVEPLFRLNGVQIQVLEVKGPRVSARLAGRTVGTTLPSILALKRGLVRMMSDACGEKMQLVEVNMLEPGI